jgi:hypothetical protein
MRMQSPKERNVHKTCVFQITAHICTVVFQTKSRSLLRADLRYEMSVNDVCPYNSRDLAQKCYRERETERRAPRSLAQKYMSERKCS